MTPARFETDPAHRVPSTEIPALRRGVSTLRETGDLPLVGDDPSSLESMMDSSEVTSPHWPRVAETAELEVPVVALGETLQLVKYARRGDTLLISGITPHGRRLTFEQREDRQGWYVVAAGRRRRPTERELGLVVATITQEMEAALVPERQAEVRSAYRLAAASDQPGMRVQGLDAYRDLLLDEATAYCAGQTERLTVVSISYQAFKRFANRHGHGVGAAFVRALGELLHRLTQGDEDVRVFHKSGKLFRLVIVNHTSAEIRQLLEQVASRASREWIVERVWGQDKRTHPDEVNFHMGIATAYASERDADYAALAQRLSDDAYRASKLGQFRGHRSIVLAKSDYRTTIYQWNLSSEDELRELAADMDDGPAEVMAEMSDYLHELSPADLEGMAVAGDLAALIDRAIARDGFWQGTTAMRLAGERLLDRFFGRAERNPDENDYVGGFDLGDEFYGIAIEDGFLYFARGDINSAGATRVRAGLDKVQHAVGWRRADGRGIVGEFIRALAPPPAGVPSLLERVREAARTSYLEASQDPELEVNDVVDIADFIYRDDGEIATGGDIVDGARLWLVLPGRPRRSLAVLERRSGFTLRLEVDGEEQPAVIDETSGLQVKLRVKRAIISASVCMIRVTRVELEELLDEVRDDNGLDPEDDVQVIGFLRHVTDILLEEQVKVPGKIELALGAAYDPASFVRVATLEELRERHPGLFYEAIHQGLLQEEPPAEIDRELADLVTSTMLSSPRPQGIGRASE